MFREDSARTPVPSPPKICGGSLLASQNLVSCNLKAQVGPPPQLGPVLSSGPSQPYPMICLAPCGVDRIEAETRSVVDPTRVGLLLSNQVPDPSCLQPKEEKSLCPSLPDLHWKIHTDPHSKIQGKFHDLFRKEGSTSARSEESPHFFWLQTGKEMSSSV